MKGIQMAKLPAAEIAAHDKSAKAKAAHIVALSERADALVTELNGILEEIAQAEAEIARSRAVAGLSLGHHVMQRGLGSYIKSSVGSRAARPSVNQTARDAWKHAI
jgi:hypothetical protein